VNYFWQHGWYHESQRDQFPTIFHVVFIFLQSVLGKLLWKFIKKLERKCAFHGVSLIFHKNKKLLVN